jgi:hypothetical protein
LLAFFHTANQPQQASITDSKEDERSAKISGIYFSLALCGSLFLWAIGGCTDKQNHEVRGAEGYLLASRRLEEAEEERTLLLSRPLLRSTLHSPSAMVSSTLHTPSAMAAGQAFMKKHPTFEVSPENKCAVCFDRPIDVVLDPCGHKVACGLCAQSLKPQRCPICREHIQQILSSKANSDTQNGTTLEQP